MITRWKVYNEQNELVFTHEAEGSDAPKVVVEKGVRVESEDCTAEIEARRIAHAEAKLEQQLALDGIEDVETKSILQKMLGFLGI